MLSPSRPALLERLAVAEELLVGRIEVLVLSLHLSQIRLLLGHLSPQSGVYVRV